MGKNIYYNFLLLNYFYIFHSQEINKYIRYEKYFQQNFDFLFIISINIPNIYKFDKFLNYYISNLIQY